MEPAFASESIRKQNIPMAEQLYLDYTTEAEE
jgi:hypothetical protein